MKRPTFTPAARLEIRDIQRHIAKHDKKAAARLVMRLRARCFALARMPGEGAHRDGLSPGLLLCPVGNYNIYYSPAATGIEVVAIVHGSQDQATALSKR